MPSLQERIVQRAYTQLLGVALVEGRVYRSRSEALRREQTPAIILRPDLETTEAFGDEVDRNALELSVEILAREDATAERAWDAIADDVKVAAHAALMAENAIPEADKVQRFYIDWIEEEGDNTAGNCLVRYRITYLCNAADLAAGPTSYY